MKQDLHGVHTEEHSNNCTHVTEAHDEVVEDESSRTHVSHVGLAHQEQLLEEDLQEDLSQLTMGQG